MTQSALPPFGTPPPSSPTIAVADAISIQPMDAFRATVSLPGSKSLTNRALLLAALAEGDSTLTGVLFSDDTRVMLNALRKLGIKLEVNEDLCIVRVSGRGGTFDAQPEPLHLGNAGTAYRFLTAACCLADGPTTLDGIPRMRERPIGQLVDPLRELGGQVEYLDKEGYPPLRVLGGGLRGGEVTLQPTLSSQYISALLQVGGYCAEGLTLHFEGPVTSRPYVEMTLALMERFAVEAQVGPNFTRIDIAPQKFGGIGYAVEPDASNATYFLAAGAVVPGSVCTVEGLGFHSVQGDVWFAEVLQQMGASAVYEPDSITVMAPPNGERLRGIDVDLNAMPDTAQTLAVLALFADGQTTMRGIGNLRVKETDRLEALRVELTKLGATVAIDGDSLIIDPPVDSRITPTAIDTYDDHRMAMSFAVAGLAAPGVTINDPGCVNKTFPDFFDRLNDLRKAVVDSS